MRALLMLGSNQNAERQLATALELLRARFVVLACSAVHQSAAAGGMEAPAYLNQAVIIVTDLQRSELKSALRAIESELGRQRPSADSRLCPIDIDSLAGWQPDFCIWDAKSYESAYARAPLQDLHFSA